MFLGRIHRSRSRLVIGAYYGRATSWFPRKVLVVLGCDSEASRVTRYLSAEASSTSTTTQSKSSTTASGSSTEASSVRTSTALAIALLSLGAGYGIGQQQQITSSSQHHVLPDGLPRTCCEQQEHDKNGSQLTKEQRQLPDELRKIAGNENVLDGRQDTPATLPFLKGARIGQGKALCIVTPKRLVDVVDCVQAIVDANCVVLPQGQNTGLTGGSVPRQSTSGGDNTSSNRPTVVLSMKYLDRIFPVDDGQRVVCLAGVGLASLSQFLAKYFPNKESHSQLGSTFLNPTTAAGVAFGSGGTQLRKGPAYTERALYLKVHNDKWNENIVEVVNTLGIEGMQDKQLPEGRARKHMDSVAYRLDTWSRWIEEGFARDMRYSSDTDSNGKAAASYPDYQNHVCVLDKNVSRYNADISGPDLNRSEGKVVILATVHDTFEKPKQTKTYWISFDSLDTALQFRKEVCLDNPQDLPMSLEYLDRDAYDVIERSGQAMAHVINWLGATSSFARSLWNMKLWVEALPFQGAPLIVDKFLHRINPFLPSVLPQGVSAAAKNMDHHVSMTIGDFGDDNNIDHLLDRLHRFASHHGRDKVVIHDCTSHLSALTAFRFVAAPAFRTWCVGENAQGISVDYALPKCDGQQPTIQDNEAKPVKRMRYSHFGCNVVHEDLAYAPGVDVLKAKHNFKATVELKCGGKLPAEHGHGTEYTAPNETQERWKKMDPLNVLNPGVGGLSDKLKYSK